MELCDNLGNLYSAWSVMGLIRLSLEIKDHSFLNSDLCVFNSLSVLLSVKLFTYKIFQYAA